MPWQPQQRDRKKALSLVLLLHLALGAALLRGLSAPSLQQASEALVAFDVPRPVPPPPPEPIRDRASAAVREAGAEDLEARPAAIVELPPIVPLPSTTALPTADDSAPEAGAAPSAGAGRQAGPGAGAGGNGDGSGGGGSGGSGSGGLGSEARLLSGNLSRGDYRRIRGFGAPRGQAVLGIEVGADGRLTRCQPLSSSGNPALDEELCRLLARTRWEPARSRGGAPVAVSLRYVATWNRR